VWLVWRSKGGWVWLVWCSKLSVEGFRSVQNICYSPGLVSDSSSLLFEVRRFLEVTTFR
jgi:hypothetical protein